VILLGTGLGVGTAFFNLVNAVLLKSRVGDDSLVGLSRGTSPGWSFLTNDEIERVINDPPDSLTWLGGHGSVRTAIMIRGTSRSARVDSTFGPYLAGVGASALRGRLLGPEDDSAGAEAVAVLSEQYWRTAFASDPAIVGATVVVAGQPLTVVGIARDSFKGLTPGLAATDIWVPSRVIPVRLLFGKLRAGVTLEQANAEMRTRYSTSTDRNGDPGLQVVQGLSPPLQASGYVLVLATLVVGALVASIAGTSLALLLLARVATRRGEIAIRFVLGASARDITRLLGIEVGLVCIGAAVVGLAVGSTSAHIVASRFMAVSEMGTLGLELFPDWRVFLYMCGAAGLLAWVMIRIVAGQISRVDALAAMTSIGGAGGATSRAAPVRARLITSQVAGVSLLLFVAALFVRSTLAGLRFDSGFDAQGVAIGWIDQTSAGGDASRARRSNRQMLEAVREAHGISHAALVTRLPGNTPSRSLKARSDAVDLRWICVQSVSREFFDVIRLPLVRGRTFTPAEDASAAPVAVISESVAASFWPGREPLGRSLWFPTIDGLGEPIEVIGVVRDAHVDSPDPSLRRDVFIPVGYRAESSVAIVARGIGPANVVLDTLRASAVRMEPHVGLLSSRTLEEELAGTVAAARLMGEVLATLGLIGLFIAVAGLYGVTAQLAAQRRREVSIRKALGASNVALCTMLMSESVRTLLLGIVPGIVVGQLVAVSLRRSFPNLEPLDWEAFLAVSVVLLVTCLLGAVLPFWRTIRDSWAPLREL
jgi:predicted permease